RAITRGEPSHAHAPFRLRRVTPRLALAPPRSAQDGANITTPAATPPTSRRHARRDVLRGRGRYDSRVRGDCEHTCGRGNVAEARRRPHETGPAHEAIRCRPRARPSARTRLRRRR